MIRNAPEIKEEVPSASRRLRKRSNCGLQEASSSKSVRPKTASKNCATNLRQSMIFEYTPPKSKRTVEGPETPSNRKKASSSPSIKITPNKILDGVARSSPSPYKVKRPKYFPKNVKLQKKTLNERKACIEEFNKLDQEFIQTMTSKISSAQFSAKSDNSKHSCSDDIGALVPSTCILSPVNYLHLFNENSLCTSKFVCETSHLANLNGTKVISLLNVGLLFLTSTEECRFCAYLCTVASQSSVVDRLWPLIERHLLDGTYYLGWSDLKSILMNFGLTLDPVNSASSDAADKTPPKIWNFEMFFNLVERSFKNYQVNRVKRLATFLVDSIFEPLLIDLRTKIVCLLQQVLGLLISRDVAIPEILSFISRGYISIAHNRFIFQFIVCDPLLENLGLALGLKTIHELLKLPFELHTDVFGIVPLLRDNASHLKKIGLVDNYQLFLICEKLYLFSVIQDKPRSKKLLEEIIELAEDIRGSFLATDYFYFNETVIRLNYIGSVHQPVLNKVE